jgi:hypothetical protein
MFKLPGNALRVWRLVETPVVLARAWWASTDRTGKPRRGVPVCARVAVRESVADDWKNAELDESTIYDHMKIIEQRVLRITVDFLKAHDVDTSDFEKQAMNIISSGVLNMGNNNIISNNAIEANTRVMVDATQRIQANAREQ